MRCPKCSNYIPEGTGVLECLECGHVLEQKSSPEQPTNKQPPTARGIDATSTDKSGPKENTHVINSKDENKVRPAVWNAKRIIILVVGCWFIAAALTTLMSACKKAISYLSNTSDMYEILDILVLSAIGALPGFIWLVLWVILIKRISLKKITAVSVLATAFLIIVFVAIPKQDTSLSRRLEKNAAKLDVLKKNTEVLARMMYHQWSKIYAD